MTTALIAASAAVVIVAMLCFAALRAWRGWLDLRRLELAQRPAATDADEENVGLRIELAAVRERLKKLEAIASGVDL